MKGPGIRLDLDVRREWECPECGKHRRVTGETVSVRCNCTKGGANMKLVESRRQTRSFADVIERVQQASQAKEKSKGKKRKAVDEKKPDESSAAADNAAETETTESQSAEESNDQPAQDA
jgi:hypothetical protein